MVRIDLENARSSYGLWEAYVGDKEMSALLVGTTSVTRDRIYNLDGERSTPKGGVVTVPSWATSFSYVVTGAGKGGLDGNGGFGAYGNGGKGGEVKAGWMLVQPEKRSISYSLGASYNRGKVGGSSSLSYGGKTIICEGGSDTNGGQSGTSYTVEETHSSLGKSADDWLTRLKVSRNNNDGTKYRPGDYGTGNAGAGTRGGGGAGGNGGIFGNYTPGGWGGPGYIRIVFWGFDETLHSRNHELFFKPNDQVFAANFVYEVPGGDSKGLLVPQDDLTTLSNFDIYYHSEYISYLDDYTFGVKKGGEYYVSVTGSDPDTGQLLNVSEVSIIIKDRWGTTITLNKETDTHTCILEGTFSVGDIIVPSVKTTNTPRGLFAVTITRMSA